MPEQQPPLPETPDDAVGEIIRERIHLGEWSCLLERPSNLDVLLDHPSTRAAFERDEYMPYWADLWPASRMLARVILEETWPVSLPLRALELGCGLGLAGIAALSRGFHVLFSDYDATAVRFAARNAVLNGFVPDEEGITAGGFSTLQLDWRYPPIGLQVPVLLAADLVYEERNVAPVVSLIRQVLVPNGVCLLTDADRVPAGVFRELLSAQGLVYTVKPLRTEVGAQDTGERRYKGTLYRIQHQNSRVEDPAQRADQG